jgi:hypothetical protein
MFANFCFHSAPFITKLFYDPKQIRRIAFFLSALLQAEAYSDSEASPYHWTAVIAIEVVINIENISHSFILHFVIGAFE